MDKNYFANDTIVASATGLNVRSAIGVLRVSGPMALTDAGKYVRLKSKNARANLETRNFDSIRTRYLYRCDVLSRDNAIIDDGLVAFFPAPNSYSGEDMVEVHLHGNPLIQREVIDSIVHNTGARPAERGEFSFRAFRNGKLDLSQVEAVEALISAETSLGLEAAVKSLSGAVKRFIDPIQEDLKNLIASLELELDFSDQDVEVLDWSLFEKKLQSVQGRLRAAVVQFDSIRPAMNGVTVSFVGRPNAGKSTLFNVLVGEERSIVSQIEGTTRDVIREQIYLDGLLLRLSDTAGMRDTSDVIESEGVKRSLEEIKDSELVLVVIDSGEAGRTSASAPLLALIKEVSERAGERKLIFVFNKIDNGDALVIKEFISNHDLVSNSVIVSSTTGQGLLELQEKIKSEFVASDLLQISPEIFCQRQREALVQAMGRLSIVSDNIQTGIQEMDLLAIDIRSAMVAISELSGSIDSEAILEHIFSNFCIGK